MCPCWELVVKYRFVGSVGAIDISVAFPFVGNANIIAAVEVAIGRASGFWTVITLVRVVSAVVFSVAKPSLLNAAAVGAREFVERAIGIYRKWRGMKSSQLSSLFDQRAEEFASVIN